LQTGIRIQLRLSYKGWRNWKLRAYSESSIEKYDGQVELLSPVHRTQVPFGYNKRTGEERYPKRKGGEQLNLHYMKSQNLTCRKRAGICLAYIHSISESSGDLYLRFLLSDVIKRLTWNHQILSARW
jgi:hypothetical protein